MELAGGLLLGVVFMFSLLAFNPGEDSPIARWFTRELGALRGTQTAGVAAAPLSPSAIRDMQDEKRERFSLISSGFANGSIIPTRYTCDGKDISPPFSIRGVPEEAQSLVLIMDDPDATGGVIWDHWVVFNIPPSVREIAEGQEPPGRAGKNSWGRSGYGGPCPRRGEHRYSFHLYALNKTLPLRQGSTKEEVLTAIEGSVLESVELVGRYQRLSR